MNTTMHYSAMSNRTGQTKMIYETPKLKIIKFFTTSFHIVYVIMIDIMFNIKMLLFAG